MPEQKEMITNLENFYKSREEVFNFFNDYIKMYTNIVNKAKRYETKGTGRKMLTSKQMIQRLPIQTKKRGC